MNRTSVLLAILLFIFDSLYVNAQKSITDIKGVLFDGQKYVITGKVDLRNNTLSFPNGSVVVFDGGSIVNGTIIFDNVELKGEVQILAKVEGSVKNDYIDVRWFGVESNTTRNQTERIQEIVNLFSSNVPTNSWDINLKRPEPQIKFPAGRFYLDEVKIRSYMTIRGQGRGSTELRGVSFTASGQFNINLEDMSLVGTEKKYPDSSVLIRNILSGRAALSFKDCGRVIVKNVAIRDYFIAIDFYNTVLTDFYSCYISYCGIGFKNDGKGNGYGGHAIRWFGGEISESNIGMWQKNGNSVSFIGAAMEGCGYAFYLDYPISFTINSCYFEANKFDIYGNIIHTNIEDSFFSDARKDQNGTYIYAESIGVSSIRGNKFSSQIGDHPYIEVEKGARYYHNLYIGQNDIIGGGRIIVSNEVMDAVEERGRQAFQTYLPDGENMLIGQTIVYKNPRTGKYYLVTRDTEGKLLFLPFIDQQ